MKLNKKTRTEELIKKILHLSFRISILSPPMKPFIRFSESKGGRKKEKVLYSAFFWDFDDLLQKKLLGFLYEIASADTIIQFCTEQWKHNLESLYREQKEALERTIRNDTKYSLSFDYRMKFLVERMKGRSRLLYVGCGCGRECLPLAKKGLFVVGIDTNPLLVDIANAWAEYFDLPFEAVCMDLMDLDFEPKSFDAFLLEFYGSWPLLTQTISVQRKLAHILNDQGKGFVVAFRKKYASYWFLMRSLYPASMANWLIPQTSLDFYFSEAENCQERLLYGLYNRSHTLASLSSELKHTFEVVECVYDEDPRYIIAVTKRKNENGLHNTVQGKPSNNLLEKEIGSPSLVDIGNALKKIEVLCNQLEVHAKKVSAFFENPKKSSPNNCWQSVSTNVSEFRDLLKDV